MEEPASEASYAYATAQSASESAAHNAQTLQELRDEVARLDKALLQHDDGTPRLTKKQIAQRLLQLQDQVNLNTAQVEECMKAISQLATMVHDTRDLIVEVKKSIDPTEA